MREQTLFLVGSLVLAKAHQQRNAALAAEELKTVEELLFWTVFLCLARFECE